MASRFNNKDKDLEQSRKSGENWRTFIDSGTVDLRKVAEMREEASAPQKPKIIRPMKDVGAYSDIDTVRLQEESFGKENLSSRDIEIDKSLDIITSPEPDFFSKYMEELENLRPLSKAMEVSENAPSKEKLSDELSEIDSKDMRIQNSIVKTVAYKQEITPLSQPQLKESIFKFIPRQAFIQKPEVKQKPKLTPPVSTPVPNPPDALKFPEPQPKQEQNKKELVSAQDTIKKNNADRRAVLSGPNKKENKTFIKKALSVSVLVSLAIVGVSASQKITSLKEGGQEHAKLAYSYMQTGQNALFAFDTKLAEENFLKAKEEFEAIEQDYTFFGYSAVALSASFPLQSELTSVSHLVRAGELYSLAGWEASRSLSSLQIVNASLGSSESDTYFTDNIVLAGLGLKKAGNYLKEANAEISMVRPEDIPDEFEKDIRQLQSKTSEIEVLFEETFASLDALLVFLGHNEARNYILIFQNNSELRATGGFIGTYGLLAFNKGNIRELFIDGIYNPDGQLKVNEFFVIPPKPLQYVTPYWGTRDANWFFDFPSSAEKIAWFYKQTGGPPPGETDFGRDLDIHGVIALNTNVLTKLLELTGPIEMESYGITLTSDNWLEIVQKEVEQDYDKELNRPKQILADLTPVLIERIGEHDKKIDLINIFLESLEKKDILVYSRDADVGEFLASEGWDGAIDKQQASSDGITEDYLAVVVSNVGGWKTDIYTDTEVDTVTKLSDSGEIIRTVIISRKHNGGSTPFMWYNKPNHAYLRVYVPKGSELLSAEGFSKAPPYIKTDYKAKGYLEDPLVVAIDSTATNSNGADMFEESGKTVFGNWLWVPAGDRVLVTLTYKLPYALQKGISSYELVIQKQSGIDIKYSGSIEEFDSALDIISCHKEDEELAGGQFNFVQEADTYISCELAR